MSRKRPTEDDDAEDYVPSDSDDELTSREKTLLKNAYKKDEVTLDSDDEVYGVASDSSSDLAASDVEGQEEDDDDLPDLRAWGKDKRKYYSTDYVDPDYGGYQEKDAALADYEEQTAKNLQKFLMEQLDDDDFALEGLSREADVEDTNQTEETIISDVSNLSKRQKLAQLAKESPELFGLIEDSKKMGVILQDLLTPVIQLALKTESLQGEALDFVKMYHSIILNYSINISMYLLLKASNVNVQNHPVIKRLYHYRKLLSQVNPIFEETVRPQIELLLENAENIESNQTIPKTKLLNILKSLGNLVEKNTKEKPKQAPKEGGGIKQKRVRFEDDSDLAESKETAELAEGESEPETMEEESEPEAMEDETNKNTNKEDEDNEESRRSITYQIAKNKGLTPRRNKLQRNPRVKHRDKYRKAKIRRKGAVRETRRELSRYGGEISGIKASVTKSIKIKS